MNFSLLTLSKSGYFSGEMTQDFFLNDNLPFTDTLFHLFFRYLGIDLLTLNLFHDCI